MVRVRITSYNVCYTKLLRNTAIILMHCPDQRGIVTNITKFIHENNGNIINLEQHVDRDGNRFFMRIEWELNGFNIPKDKIAESYNFV